MTSGGFPDVHISPKTSLACVPLISPENLAALITLVKKGEMSGTQAKEVFGEMWTSGKPPDVIARERGITQISRTEEVAGFVDEVLQKNADLVERYRRGETKLLGALVGQVMKFSGGKANPNLVNQILRKKLTTDEG